MNKRILIGLCVSLCSLAFIQCDSKDDVLEDIKIGKENISTLTLEKQVVKKILLTGGNGKYRVNVENSQIVSITINLDTLIVQGLNLGNTYATISSHDFKKKLDINIVLAGLSVSSQAIELRPGEDKTQEISVSGGGHVRVAVTPEGVVEYKLNANGYLELYPKYEGKAIFSITSEDDKEVKNIEVTVKPKGEIEGFGWYSTRAASYIPLTDNRMIVTEKNVGTWFFGHTRPNDKKNNAMFVSAIMNPKEGKEIEVDVSKNTFRRKAEPNDNIVVGKHSLIVEYVDNSSVTLLGKGVKLKLPY